MPDTEEVKKTVDIDTSGPAMDVDVPEEKDVAEVEQPEVKEENPSVRPVTEDNEREVKLDDQKEPKEELEQYSDSVQKRIAKLTKKMRESERREEAATIYAKSVLAEKEALSARLSKLDTGFVSEKENRIKAGMEAAVAKLAKAREESDLKAEVAATADDRTAWNVGLDLDIGAFGIGAIYTEDSVFIQVIIYTLIYWCI